MLRFLGIILTYLIGAHAMASAQTSRGVDAITRDAAPPPSLSDRAIAAPLIQSPTSAETSVIDVGSVQIGAVQIAGLSQLSHADFVDIAERYAGQTVGKSGLQELARAVANRARDRGYIFASAIVPAQELEIGIVRVQLDEGIIEEVRVQGSGNERVRALLGSLAGTTVRKQDVERLLLLAEDIPGVTVERTRFVRENRRGILIVDVSADDARGSARIDNAGPDAFGPVRARLEFELNGLFDADDQLATYTQVTPLQPSELAFASARYTNIVSDGGLQIGISAGAGRTRDQDRESPQIARGRSRYVAASLTAPLVRSNQASLWVSSEFGYLNVEQTFGRFAQRDDIATFTLSGWGNFRTANGQLALGVSATRGLGILGATRAGDIAASRLDGSGRFTKLNVWANWNEKLGNGYTMRVAMNGQTASRPLLSSQEIGFGGPSFGRGYDYSERFGDRGIMGLAELRRGFDRPAKRIDWAQLYGFVDAGYIDNFGDGFGGGTLASGGGGIRAGVFGTEIGLEVAQPFNATQFGSGNRAPKLNVSIGYGF